PWASMSSDSTSSHPSCRPAGRAFGGSAGAWISSCSADMPAIVSGRSVHLSVEEGLQIAAARPLDRCLEVRRAYAAAPGLLGVVADGAPEDRVAQFLAQQVQRERAPDV